jgi:hypothetical protein
MQTAAEKNLKTLESELKRIAHLVQGFDSDFERVDAVAHSVNRALQALFDYTAPAVEEVPAGIAWPEAA